MEVENNYNRTPKGGYSTDNKNLKNSLKQKITNVNKMTNYSLRCINCGRKSEINLVAHRNKKEYVCGFIAVCSDCSRLLDKSKRTIQLVIEEDMEKR